MRMKLLEKGLSQREVAQRAGMTEGLMSLIVSGRYLPDHQQRKRIADAIQVPEKELFEKIFRI